jgi:hypothetical protein
LTAGPTGPRLFNVSGNESKEGIMLIRNGMVMQSLAIASVAAFGSGMATAGISLSNAGVRYTTQSSNAGAGPVYAAFFEQSMTVDPSPADFASVSATFPDGSSLPMTDNGVGNYTVGQAAPDEFSEGTLQPTGVYTIAVQGGTLGDGSASFTQPSISFPSILSLTNYDSLIAADPAADFVGNLTALTIDPTWDLAIIYIQVTNLTTTFGVFAETFGPSESSFTLPAGTFNPNDSYQVRLQTLSYKYLETFDASGSLAEATAYTVRISVNDITFTAIPAPGSVALIGLAGLAIRRRR